MVKKTEYKEIVGKRSIFGHIAKYSFWCFNLFMALWVYLGLDVTVGKEGSLSTAESIGGRNWGNNASHFMGTRR